MYTTVSALNATELFILFIYLLIFLAKEREREVTREWGVEGAEAEGET